MELKFVIPNMEKTFGNLEFAGEDKVVQRRINGRLTVLSRSYNLYSDVQRADDIVVVLPAEAGEKHFGFEERVKLVNPRITAVMNKLKQIVMLGRQAGFFLILACQRPDAKYLGDGIRDQFNFRVALGRMSEMGYGMMFGSDVQKDFFLKRIKGRGYVDVGTSVISEFYTPLVPKGYDFLEEIKKLSNSRQSTQATCEAEVAGVD
ncbi:DNA translocase FtsK [Streptococcus pyogenes]|uniref:YdcP family protein n=1 Tax=Streptococcus pyogenes TaxID=1314 RepID=UPI0010DD6A6F|nr:YdcP family protein [Streptococcus pyogenes]VHC44545.1 DNA translocase FtsK [Streptococcus pyogenes]